MSSRPEFYTVLGLAVGAAPDDVRRAYRALARQLHPDANPGDPGASARFSVLHEAYRVLSTPALRAAYDQALRTLHPELDSVPPSSIPRDAFDVSDPAAPGMARGGATNPQFYQPGGTVLALHVVPGLAALAPSRERSVFYVLAELAVAVPLYGAAPVAVALAIECSSAMRGPWLEAVRRAIHGILSRLGPQDRIVLVGYDDQARVLADGAPGEVRAALDQPFDRFSGHGQADLVAGLSVTIERLAAHMGRQRVSGVLALTRGHTQDEQRCRQLAERAREAGVAIASLGIGTEWSRDLLDEVAANTGGASDHVERPEHLDAIFSEWLTGLRASVATDLRLSFEPAPGVAAARATRVAPEIADLFTQSIAAGGGIPPTATAQVYLGMVADHGERDGTALVWQLMLHPDSLVVRDGAVRLGRLVAQYMVVGQSASVPELLEVELSVPLAAAGEEYQLAPQMRGALELITAYRLQVQADYLLAAGRADEAAARLSTSALRLRGAGRHELAAATQRAADALADRRDEGLAELLRIRYDTRHLGAARRRRVVG